MLPINHMNTFIGEHFPRNKQNKSLMSVMLKETFYNLHCNLAQSGFVDLDAQIRTRSQAALRKLPGVTNTTHSVIQQQVNIFSRLHMTTLYRSIFRPNSNNGPLHGFTTIHIKFWIWNSLQPDTRVIDSHHSYLQSLKSHSFRKY